MKHLIWITGLAGSGKTTLAKEVYKRVVKRYVNTIFLDGDDFREIMMNELGHNKEDRVKNAWRIAKLCNFLTDQNMIVICATMSLYHEIQEYNRQNNVKYTEVFVKVPIEELMKRDKKNLYSEALIGNIENVVGIDLPIEEPKLPTLVLDNSKKEYLKENISKIVKLVI